MKILLTGANGYIGMRLLPLLLQQGHEVVCAVRNRNRLSVSNTLRSKIDVVEIDFLQPYRPNVLPNDIDVLVLAALYTTRIIAGSEATGIEVSEWLLAFAGFLFLSLAFVKRYTELIDLRNSDRIAASGRGYVVDDLGMLAALGGASGYLSVLVFALSLRIRRREIETMVKIGGSRGRIAAVLVAEVLVVLLLSATLAGGLTAVTGSFASVAIRAFLLS